MTTDPMTPADLADLAAYHKTDRDSPSMAAYLTSMVAEYKEQYADALAKRESHAMASALGRYTAYADALRVLDIASEYRNTLLARFELEDKYPGYTFGFGAADDDDTTTTGAPQ